MYFIFTILLALVDLSFAGCHPGTIRTSNKWLGLKTQSVTNGGHDAGDIYARIYTSTWNRWHRLDTSSCNDFGKGQADYFDDFDHISAAWRAVALYNCGNDGLAVDGIYYWDGNSYQDNYIAGFCGDVAGPFANSNCFAGTSSGSCGTRGGPFDYVWIDQNDRACPGIVVRTGSNVGTGFGYPSPGTPDCVGEYGAYVPNNFANQLLLNSADDSTNELFNGMMILGAVIMILTLTMCVLIRMMVKKNKNKRYYQEVDVVSS